MRDALKSAPWNAQIPENWERRALKYCARMKGRLGWQNLRADEYTDEGPFLVTSEHFKDDQVEWGRCYHVTEERYAMAPEIQLRPQDVFFMKDGAAMGKLAYVDRLPGPACLNSHLLLFRPRRDEFTTRFLYYVLRSPLFQEFISTEATGTTFLGISQESVGTFPLPLPPLSTQRAIAAFLDRETGRVDRLVAKKRELIERLTEKRTALISRTVTRGLPPAAARAVGLPANPPLKPSALDWLGDIPKHWEVCKLKRVTTSRCDGPFGSGLKSEHYCDDGVRVIRLQNIRFAQFDDRDAAFIEPEYYKELGDHSVLPGDLLIAGLGDENHPVGRACVAPPTLGPAMVKADCFRFRLNPKRATSTYVALQLSTTANALAGALATGTTRGRMNLSATEDREIALPPLHEQAAIAAYLDEETVKLDALVGKVEEAVERLQEYRTALITAAVTGKIDVRGSVARPGPNK